MEDVIREIIYHFLMDINYYIIKMRSNLNLYMILFPSILILVYYSLVSPNKINKSLN